MPANGVTSNDWISTYCARAGVAAARTAASVSDRSIRTARRIGLLLGGPLSMARPEPVYHVSHVCTNRRGRGPRVAALQAQLVAQASRLPARDLDRRSALEGDGEAAVDVGLDTIDRVQIDDRAAADAEE